MGLGVLFLIQLSLMAWFYLSDPLGLFSDISVTEMVTGESKAETKDAVTSDATGTKESSSTGPSQAQVEAASQAGIEIPTFTSEQTACFRAVLGDARVNEIIAGAVPSPVELFKAKSCLE